MFTQHSRWHTTSLQQSWHTQGLLHTVLCSVSASLMVGWNAERWRAGCCRCVVPSLPNKGSGAACPGAFEPPFKAFATKCAVLAACLSAFSFKYWSGKRAAEGVEGCGRFLILNFESDTRNIFAIAQSSILTYGLTTGAPSKPDKAHKQASAHLPLNATKMSNITLSGSSWVVMGQESKDSGPVTCVATLPPATAILLKRASHCFPSACIVWS